MYKQGFQDNGLAMRVVISIGWFHSEVFCINEDFKHGMLIFVNKLIIGYVHKCIP